MLTPPQAASHGRRLAATFAAVALLAAACSTGGPSTAPTTGPTTAATTGATATPTEPPKPSGKIVVSNWDLYFPEDMIANFTAETGIEVEWVKHTTNEDIVGKLEAANGTGYDVVFVSAQFAEALNNRGWLETLDHSALQNVGNLAPEADQLGYDPGNTFSVPYTWGTTGLCYRTDLVPAAPTSWNDLLKPVAALDKKITMLATDRWLMLPALKVLGYSANETDQGHLEEARDILLETKTHLLAYDDTTFYSRLVSGEASLVQAWDGWCNYGIADEAVGSKIAYVVPSEGTDLWADTMTVLKASTNKPAAYAFIDYILRPEVGKTVVDLTLYKVPNPAAMDLVDPAVMAQFTNLAMSPAELLKGEPLRDLGAAAPLWSNIVTQITAGG
ncbi:MAG TPA: spermidine/putrescine ABC transporter substrate-binding protein [Candidatus Limnocylindria bacterium]|nr:spermidine/putrescine ABC transporter substrate-binding protein [Candidatus Limnocylindria bacterium]